MRVLVLAESLPTPDRPADGRFVWRHVQAMATWADVVPVHLVLTRRGRPTVGVEVRRQDGLQVLEMRCGGPPVLAETAAARAVGKLLRTTRADVLHSMAMETLLVAVATPRHGRPWVHTEHSSNVNDPPGGAIGRYVGALSRTLLRPDLVTAASDFLRDGIVALGRTAPTRVVPNVVAAPAPRRARRPAAAPTLLAVGALVPSKRPLLAVETLAELRRRGIPARLTWIGDGPLAADFDRTVARLGVADVAVRRPFAEPDRYLAMLSEADLFLLPTEFETFCVSAAEAIACGVPVVVGARGGQRDFVGPDTGLLVEAGTAAAYADAVGRVLAADPALPGPGAVAALRERFSPAAVSAALRASYEDANVRPRGGLT